MLARARTHTHVYNYWQTSVGVAKSCIEGGGRAVCIIIIIVIIRYIDAYY